MLIFVAIILALLAYALLLNTKETGLQQQGNRQDQRIPATVSTENKNRLISGLPYEADGYTAEYFPDQDYFFIQINKGSFKEYKAKAETWLKANGVEPTMVQIQWSSTRDVAP